MQRHRLIFLGAAVVSVVFVAALVLTARPAALQRWFNDLASASQCRSSAAIATAVEPLAVGAMAPFTALSPVDVGELPYHGTGDATRSLEELSGQVTLLNLWATWCAPCRAEMPELAALHAARSGADFRVVAVSIDHNENGRPEAFLAETGAANLAYHREPSLRLFNSLRAAGLAQGMPTTLLLGPDGCAAGVLHGAAAWNAAEAHRLIDAAVAAAR